MDRRPVSAGPSFTFYRTQTPYYSSQRDVTDEETQRQEVVTYRKSRKPRESWLQREAEKNNLLVKNQEGSEYTLLRQVSVQALADNENIKTLKQQHRRIYVEEGSFSAGQEKNREVNLYTKKLRELENEQKRHTIQLSSVYDAAHTGDLTRIKQMIKRFPEMINSRNENGYTLLHIASQSGRVEVLKWLAAENAILDIQSSNGYTAMHVCAVKGNVKCMRVLAAMGASIDYISAVDKQTPLHLACMKGHVECVKWLVANRANINIRDIDDFTPKMLAEKYGHAEITDFLKAVEDGSSDPRNIFTLLRTNSYTSKTVYQTQHEKEIISIDKAVFASNFTAEYVLGRIINTQNEVGLYQMVDLSLPIRHPYTISEVIIHFPSGKKDYPSIQDNQDGTVTVRFQPTETGLHKLYVNYSNNAREANPILFVVNAVTSDYMKAYGHGLSHGVIGEPAGLTLVMKDSNIGTPLQINFGREVRSEAKPPPQPITFQQDEVESRCEFCLKIPVAERDTRADLIFAIDASGSVGKANFDKELDFVTRFIQDYPIGEQQVQCSVLLFGNNAINEFFLNKYYNKAAATEAINEIKNRYPSRNNTNTAQALQLIRQETLLQENGAQTGCKKFVIILTDGASTNKNETLREADLLKKCKDVTVLSVGIGSNLNKDELYAMASGKELVFMSPTFDALKTVNEEVKKYTMGTWNIRMSSLNQQKGSPSATFKISCTFPFDLKASVKSPSGSDVKCDVNMESSNQYSVGFEPSEAGVHKVIAIDSTTPIPGSPFEFKIDPMAVKNKAPPQMDVVQLIQDKPDIKPYQFNVFARPAGSGETTITIEGPSKAQLNFEKKQDGTCAVTYFVSEPGEYTISIKCNNEHIPNSPFKARFTGKCSFVFCNCKTFRNS